MVAGDRSLVSLELLDECVERAAYFALSAFNQLLAAADSESGTAGPTYGKCT